MEDFENLSESQRKVAKLVAQKAREAGVDPELALALAYVENRFKPKGVSEKGAIGPMQILPVTGKAYGYDAKDLYDVEKNVELGVRILKDNLINYNGNTRAALANYNTTTARTKKFMEGGEDFNALLPETRGFLEDIDALRNTDATGLINVSEKKSAPIDFGSLPSDDTQNADGAAPAPQTAPADAIDTESMFGAVDENDAVGQPPPPVQEPEQEPKTLLGQAEDAISSGMQTINENPEVAAATGLGAVAGYKTGQAGLDAAQAMRDNVNRAQINLTDAKTQQAATQLAKPQLTQAIDKTYAEINDTVQKRQAKLDAMNKLVTGLEDDIQRKAAPDLRGAQKYVNTLGGDDLPFNQKTMADNMRSNNPTGGQSIINQNAAAKQKLSKMGLSNYQLTTPQPGQLALPPELAAEELRRNEVAEKARRQALLAAQKRAADAKASLENAERIRALIEKNRALTQTNTEAGTIKAQANTQAAMDALNEAKSNAPSGLGKVGEMAQKYAGKTIGTLGGIAAPLTAAEAVQRYRSGDTSGAVLSGFQSLFAAMAMLPPGTPITAFLKGLGITGELAATAIDLFRQSSQQKPPPPPPPPKSPLSQAGSSPIELT
jgi:hypothetical protein